MIKPEADRLLARFAALPHCLSLDNYQDLTGVWKGTGAAVMHAGSGLLIVAVMTDSRGPSINPSERWGVAMCTPLLAHLSSLRQLSNTLLTEGELEKLYSTWSETPQCSMPTGELSVDAAQHDPALSAISGIVLRLSEQQPGEKLSNEQFLQLVRDVCRILTTKGGIEEMDQILSQPDVWQAFQQAVMRHT